MDAVNHPTHYTSHASGVECIEIVEGLSFCIGNAIKYLWRSGLKSDVPAIEYRKALWYLRREVTRLRAAGAYGTPSNLRSREAAARVVEREPDGALRDVLLELLPMRGDHVTAVQLVRAAHIVERALEREQAA